MQKRASGHKYQSTHKVQTKQATQKSVTKIHNKIQRKALCHSDKMQLKEEGFGEARRKRLCRSVIGFQEMQDLNILSD